MGLATLLTDAYGKSAVPLTGQRGIYYTLRVLQGPAGQLAQLAAMPQLNGH